MAMDYVDVDGLEIGVVEHEQDEDAALVRRVLADLAAAGGLSSRTVDVLTRRYLAAPDEVETLAQIGATMGVSRERVRQIEAKALKVLKRAVEAARRECDE
jgi:DNA-directed RNA polymerase sigma subunit (sigma70/sigma32)